MPVNVPLKLNVKDSQQTIAVVGDIHAPYHDAKVINLVWKFLKETQPEYLILNGDICDFYQASKFDKDPARMAGLSEDIELTRKILATFRDILPDTKIILISGTHEHRWEKFLWSGVPIVSNIGCLSIQQLYGLDKLEIEYVPYEKGLLINKVFLVLHGNFTSIHSAYTAKRMYEKHGGCGMCNHTHRGGSFYKTDRFGTWGWWENFCLCRLDPDWIMNPNWQHGFSLIHFTNHSRFWVESIPIIDYKMLYGGSLRG